MKYTYKSIYYFLSLTIMLLILFTTTFGNRCNVVVFYAVITFNYYYDIGQLEYMSRWVRVNRLCLHSPAVMIMQLKREAIGVMHRLDQFRKTRRVAVL